MRNLRFQVLMLIVFPEHLIVPVTCNQGPNYPPILSSLLCPRGTLRQSIKPEPRDKHEHRHLFIQEASTKNPEECARVVDRIARILHVRPEGERERAIVAGDEETFRFMYRLKQREGKRYSWLMPYPGDWHLLLHAAKAMLKRYWGAGVEYVAKRLSGDDRKAAEGSDYRRSHHHLTVMYEAFMRVVIERFYAACSGREQRATDMEDDIPNWIEELARQHKTFSLWSRFLLDDYPAYLSLRVALRTGDFKLRLAALRRIAPISCGYGKDRYQWLVSVHLADMTRMTDDDMASVSCLFATSLGGDAFSLVGLDERQEVANRLYKGAVMKVTRGYVPKLPAIVSEREAALTEVHRMFFDNVKNRDPIQELVRKRCPAVETAREALECGYAFAECGRSILMALDGRSATVKDAEEILKAPELCAEKLKDVIRSAVFQDKNSSGPTKKHFKSFLPRRTSNKPSIKIMAKDETRRQLKSTEDSAMEMLGALRTLAVGSGKVSGREVEQRMLSIGTAVPQALVHPNGGECVCGTCA